MDLDADVDLDTPLYDLDGNPLTGHLFTPPTDPIVGPVNPDTTGNERRLMGFFPPHERGRNIWKLADGTITDVQPGYLATTQFAAEGNMPWGVYPTASYVKVWYGGHSTPVSDEEVAELTAAGYGSFIT